MSDIHVVVGAGRPLGANVVRLLSAKGRSVRAIVLDAKRAHTLFPESVEIVGVSPETQSIQSACGDASVIFNCFEPHDREWARVNADMTSKLLATAIQAGARYVLTSHLFLSETDNQAAEQDALNTHASKLAPTVIARLPQMYGPGISNPLFTEIFEAAVSGKKAHWIGSLDTPHSFLYVLDAASAVVMLAESDVAYGNAWNIAGPGPLTGREFIELAFKAANKEKRIGVWGRGIILTASLLDSRSRALLDIPYDYYRPFVIDGGAFVIAFPSFAYTPHEVAMVSTFEWFVKNAESTSAKSAAGGLSVLSAPLHTSTP